jgi:hypothetical protein
MKCSNLNQPSGVAWCQIVLLQNRGVHARSITVLKKVENDMSRNPESKEHEQRISLSKSILRDEAADRTNCRKCLSITEVVSKCHDKSDLPNR